MGKYNDGEVRLVRANCDGKAEVSDLVTETKNEIERRKYLSSEIKVAIDKLFK